ncbi:MAG: VCBS repeat-containing protein [Ignavibacteria bacterium]|nr:VCBS repeat-containing protein [Ignavibacteria bacterium]
MKIVSTFRAIIGCIILFASPCILMSQDKSWMADVTNQIGLNGVKGARVNMVDMNNDNYPDLFVQVELGAKLSTRARNMKIYMNQQDPSSTNPGKRVFVDVTDKSGVWVHPEIPDSSRVIDIALMADLNNDGNIDLVTGPYYDRLENFKFPEDRCEVLLGDGKGHFDLVPDNGLHELGLLNCAGMTFLDYDLDGVLDLYIATWFKDKNINGFMPDYLLHGNGDGTFTDMSKKSGISTVEFPMYGATAMDWNNDGWPDVLTSAYCRSGGSLWQNNKNGTFTDVAKTVGYTSQLVNGDVDGLGARALCQWAVVPADFDNDGDIDILQAFVHGGLDFGEDVRQYQ